MTATNRAAHHAIAKTVEEHGTHAPKALYAAYVAFNRDHFDGKLGAPLVFVGACSSPRALGDYCGQDVHGLESRIRISEKAVRKGLKYATWILLHEMVHAWCQEIEGDLEMGYRGHGPRFAAKCNEIGKKLGLRDVGVKGRKGLPDCAQWPLNVLSAEERGEDERERENDDAGDEKSDDANAPRCLHCVKRAAKQGDRFCGARCALAWASAATAALVWCAEHGRWVARTCPDCPAAYDVAAE
jgi:hypothetical protein